MIALSADPSRYIYISVQYTWARMMLDLEFVFWDAMRLWILPYSVTVAWPESRCFQDDVHVPSAIQTPCALSALFG